MAIFKDEVYVEDVKRLFQKNICQVLEEMLCWKPTSDNYAKLLDVESQLVRDFFHYESMIQEESLIPNALLEFTEEVKKDENEEKDI